MTAPGAHRATARVSRRCRRWETRRSRWGTRTRRIPKLPFCTKVLVNHPDALEALIERLLPLLSTLVRRAFPGAPEDVVTKCGRGRPAGLLPPPPQFDRTRGEPLVAFLRPAAVGNLSNFLRRETRRAMRERAYVADALAAWRDQSRSGHGVHVIAEVAVDSAPYESLVKYARTP